VWGGSGAGAGHQLAPTLTPESPDFINSVMRVQMVTVGWLFQSLLSKQLWAGSPTNNNVGGGYKEFPGLETLVSTGKVDAPWVERWWSTHIPTQRRSRTALLVGRVRMK
jgi:hypothetical protein